MGYLHLLVRSPKRVIALVLFAPFLCSQVFWLSEIRSYKQRLCRGKALRICLDVAGGALYAVVFVYGLFEWRRAYGSSHLTLRAALFAAPFAWWFFGSMAGFAVYALARGLGFAGGAFLDFIRASGRRSPRWFTPGRRETSGAAPAISAAHADSGRRQLSRRTALALGAAPFAAAAYGLLGGRIDVQVTHLRLALPRLPRGFDGFRILQLSDLHIGPFMTAREIRRVVETSNRAKPDLVMLTGDFVIWDPTTQFAAVDALSGLRAPYGVWGCLGNHEMYAGIEDSITRLFAAQGVRILRHQQAIVFAHRDVINLIGVDFESQFSLGAYYKTPGYVETYLEGVERLVLPGTVNLLMSHNPDTFDRAAEMGIDLTVSGHTHGGQITLELGGEDLSPVRLLTRYVEGLFRKGGAQLYVNRGIGTIGLPIRLGAPPEITIYQLSRV